MKRHMLDFVKRGLMAASGGPVILAIVYACLGASGVVTALPVGEVCMDVVHEYPDLTVHLTLFHAAIAEGVPQKIEHNDIRWITVDEIDQYEFCPADEVILERLKQL